MNDYEKNHENCGCKHNKGVTCDVKSCQYHDGECYCTAKQISVGPTDACKCSETVCATFKSNTQA
ncbi:MAG: DUF1540 domain-containing protein [Eubacteriales bacterium]